MTERKAYTLHAAHSSAATSHFAGVSETDERLYVPGEGWVSCREIAEQFDEAARQFWRKRRRALLTRSAPSSEATATKTITRGEGSASNHKTSLVARSLLAA